MKISPMLVSLIDHMGTDLSVVNAARVSFDKESAWLKGGMVEDPVLPYWDNERVSLSEKDTKLISYLAKHSHFTPFTHCTSTFRIKCPIFVARQLHKHQVGFSVNEVSRRYVSNEPEFYLPEVWRKKADNVKQGSGEALEDQESCNVTAESITLECLYYYKYLLQAGVSAEQARMVLPQNMMTEFYMTGSLYGWARMCKLRLDPHAQVEIQEVAKMISQEMAQKFPTSWRELQLA
jgi:thymidylate synthase (FAD)